jgi:16S rRNA (guanine(966)-N(2))-methyltransferase RsmD
MRIIAGLAKGRKILSPEGMQTRPTLDRIKEAIFNIIQNEVPGSVALDLFAGTGSLGLEAASRGAEFCYLIDKSPQTYPFLQKNIENLKFKDICKSINGDAYEVLKDFAAKNIVFDLIFIDPPYLKDLIPPAVEIIDEKGLLKKDGLIVTKIDTSEVIYEGNGNIVLIDKRKYGNTTVCLYRYKE